MTDWRDCISSVQSGYIGDVLVEGYYLGTNWRDCISSVQSGYIGDVLVGRILFDDRLA